MSFRKFGGLKFSSKHNAVGSHYNTTDNLLVTQVVGQPNSHINFESDISGNISVYGNFDLSGNLTVTGSTYSQYMYLTATGYNTAENGVVPKSYVDSVAKSITLSAGQGLEFNDNDDNIIQVKNDLDFLTNVKISNNLTLLSGGTLFLPDSSIKDNYLTLNVPLIDKANNFTENNVFKTITFAKTETERQITLFTQEDANVYTHYGFNVEVLSNIGTLRYHAPNSAQHIFSLSNAENTAYSNILTINATDTTFNNNIVQSGTNIIYQTETGDNVMKTIVQNDGNTIYQNGKNGGNSFRGTAFTGWLVMKNTNRIVFEDETPTSSSILQSQGSCYFDNTSTNGQNNFIFRTNDEQATPQFQVRFAIRYDAVMCQYGIPLRIYNGDNTNYFDIKQNLFNTEITNWAGAGQSSSANGQSIILRTVNDAGGLTTNMTIQYNKVTMGQNLQVDENFTVNQNLTVTGTTSLKSTTISSGDLTITNGNIMLSENSYIRFPDDTQQTTAYVVPINFVNNAYGAGTYTYATVTVNNQGQITGISSGTAPDTPDTPTLGEVMLKGAIASADLNMNNTYKITNVLNIIMTSGYSGYIQFSNNTQQTSAYTGYIPDGGETKYTNADITLDTNGKIIEIKNGATSSGTPTLGEVMLKGAIASAHLDMSSYDIKLVQGRSLILDSDGNKTATIYAASSSLNITNKNGSISFFLGDTGSITATLKNDGTFETTAFNATSDYRIKENIEPLDETINIDNLKPVKYFNKQTKREDMGLVAHELQEVFPFLVNGEKDGKDYQSVNYNGLIPVLIKEIQDLKQEIKSLKNLFIKKID